MVEQSTMDIKVNYMIVTKSMLACCLFQIGNKRLVGAWPQQGHFDWELGLLQFIHQWTRNRAVAHIARPTRSSNHHQNIDCWCRLHGSRRGLWHNVLTQHYSMQREIRLELRIIERFPMQTMEG